MCNLTRLCCVEDSSAQLVYIAQGATFIGNVIVPKAALMFGHAALLSVPADCGQVSRHLQQHSCNSPSCNDALMVCCFVDLGESTSSEGKDISHAREQMPMQKWFVDVGHTVEHATAYYLLTREGTCSDSFDH